MKNLKSFLTLLLVLVFAPTFAGAAVVNGGFEDPFDPHWQFAGNVGRAGEVNLDTEYFSPHSGEFMASLTYDASFGGYVWENYLYQNVVLGPDDHYLSFWFDFWTEDEGPYDSFVVVVNTDPVFTIKPDFVSGEAGTLQRSGWTFSGNIDISSFYLEPRLGDTVIKIGFYAGNEGDEVYPTGVFLDDVSITEFPVPIPATLLLLGSGLVGIVGLRRKLK